MVEYGFFEMKREFSSKMQEFLAQNGVKFDSSGVEGGWTHFRIYNYTETEEKLINAKIDELCEEEEKHRYELKLFDMTRKASDDYMQDLKKFLRADAVELTVEKAENIFGVYFNVVAIPYHKVGNMTIHGCNVILRSIYWEKVKKKSRL